MPSLRHAVAVGLVRAQPRGFHPSIATVRRLLDGFTSLLPVPDVAESAAHLGGRPGLWLTARDAVPELTILYLHGGGYCAGSVDSHRGLAARLGLAAGASTFLLDYRLAPESPFPAALEDAVAAYESLIADGEPGSVVVAGDSAGGGLVLALLVNLRERNLPQPAAGFCMSPWTDLAVTGASARSGAIDDPMLRLSEILEWGRLYAGDAGVRHPLASPLYGRFETLPPLLIQVGSRELLLDDSRRVAARAARDGVDVTLQVWPGMMHVWQAFAPMVPEANEALAAAAHWIRHRTPMGAARVAGGGDPAG